MRTIINLNTIYKVIFNKQFRRLRAAKNNLLRKKRYEPGFTNLLSNKLEYVDAITCYSGFIEIFEKAPYKFNARNNTPYIIDCGANIGLSVIYFKKLYPDAKIVAFEPDPNIFKVLENNIKSFQLRDVNLQNAAVWTANTHLDFQLEGGMSGRIPKATDHYNITSVQAFRLRNYLTGHVDFLKVDIEGAEYEVIKDCADLLTNVDHLFIEYHSHIAEQQHLDEILKILSAQGFRYYIHDAFTIPSPFVTQYDMVGMDLQLNIYAKRK